MRRPDHGLAGLCALTGVVTLLLVLTLMSAPAAGAQSGTGTIVGRVLDQTGGALPGVVVEVLGQGVEHTTVTDQAGDFRLDAVPAGSFALTFRLINFTPLRRPVTVTPDQVTTTAAVLTLALSADVLVTGVSPFRQVADAENPAENLVGIAASASQGAITAAQLEARPIMRPGEVLETVPGLIVSQHAGEGKANQYYLRGFNLDHGTDFATTVAGVPVNTPTGGHAHGYTDTAFLIPELVSGVQYRKGPYFADEGDFSAAGAANINYVTALERPLVRLSAGNFGWGRALAAASPSFGGGHLLAALEVSHMDGPWDRPDDYTKRNLLVRFSRGTVQNGIALTGSSYTADWNSTDQVPRRAIVSGQISRFGLIDPSDRGSAGRQTIALELQRASGRGSLRASAFALRNRLTLFSNFTYFLENPEQGDQIEQAERRTATGGRVAYRRHGRLAGRHTESAAGLQVRYDAVRPAGLYQSAGGRRLFTIREDRVGQTMLGVYGQTEMEWTRHLRTTVGLRQDVYAYAVTSDNPLNSGRGAATLLSPKFAAAFGPWASTEFYANAGLGFHSNDARGAVTRVAPRSGEAVEPVTPLVRARGAEAGVRTVRVRGLQSTASLWYLTLDSELLFAGDAGTTEAGRPSRRLGVEWTNYWRLRPWLTLDVDVSLSRARFRDEDPSGNQIPGALDRVVAGGLTVEPTRVLFGSLRVRHFGPRPLIEDASVLSASTTLWNAEVGRRLTSRSRVVVELFNLFAAEGSDIDYFYRSRLPGEPAEGVEDIHTHPALPRSARVGLQVRF